MLVEEFSAARVDRRVVCVCQTREMMQENATLKGRLAMTLSQLDSVETDQKAQRDTITTLMHHQQNIAQFNIEMDNLRVVRSPFILASFECLLQGQLETTVDSLFPGCLSACLSQSLPVSQ